MLPVNVIPANAGVILNLAFWQHPRTGYPRECGGDPRYDTFETGFLQVIPANAGVILTYLTMSYIVTRYPRECGGDPTLQIL